MINFGLVLWLVLAYISGSLCSAIIVCRCCGLSDPRQGGSNNPGATNVLRLHGKKYAALVFLGDALKAVVPLMIAHLSAQPYSVLAWMGALAVLGHVYPIFFKFNGGKGVATALGVYFGLSCPLGLMILAIWLGMAYWRGYSSLASITAILCAPMLACWWLQTSMVFLPLLGITMLIVCTHIENIQRLCAGQESKLKF